MTTNKQPLRDMIFRSVRHEGATLYDVGIRANDTLHNPNGYDDVVVRAAVLAAEARWRERRSRAAKKAAVTRASRTAKLVYNTATRILQGSDIGPRKNCAICGRGLSDQEAIDRGIGSECWQDVLKEITQRRVKEHHET